jgi:pyruvate formate lyase activating enzyme
MNREQHKRYTGVYNDSVLQNAHHIAKKKIPMLIRIPIIPGINDTENNLNDTANFVLELDRKLHIDLLSYHNFGENKYKALDMNYQLSDLKSPDEKHMRWCQEIFLRKGLDCETH